MRLTFFLFFSLLFLSACTSPSKPPIAIQQTQSSKKAVDEDFLIELQNNREELARLVTMEQDLKVLIAALSAQSELQSLPISLRNKPKVKEYKGQVQSNQVISSSKKSQGFKLHLQPMFSEASAQAQLNRVHNRFPQLSNLLSSSIKKQTHKLQSRYVGVLETVSIEDDANKLCAVINNIGVLCTVEESR